MLYIMTWHMDILLELRKVGITEDTLGQLRVVKGQVRSVAEVARQRTALWLASGAKLDCWGLRKSSVEGVSPLQLRDS